MSLDGVIYVVRLFEVMIDEIRINENRTITWPRVIEDEKVPAIDGVLILYDVTNEESVTEVPDVLCKSGPTRKMGTGMTFLDVLARYPISCHFPCLLLTQSCQMR
jgi:hypothetical protein